MKKGGLFLLFALIAIGVSASGAENANAQSAYDSIIDSYSDVKGIDDDYYIQASQLDILDFSTREIADYLRGNDEYIGGYDVYINTGNSSTCDSSDWINAGNRIITGSFIGLSTDYYNGTSRIYNTIEFSTLHDVSNLTMEFGETLHSFNNRGVYKGGFVNAGSQDMAKITAYYAGSGTIGLYCWNGNANGLYQWQGSNVTQGSLFSVGYLYDNWYPNDTASWNGYYLNYLPSGTDVVYPVDYEGSGLPNFPVIDEGAGQPDWTDQVPNFYVSTSVGWLATIHDQNFNTVDGIPFSCSEGLAPVLYWEIWDRSSEPEVLLESGYHNATAQIVYQFEKETSNKDYRIIGWYDCGDVPEIQFYETSYKDFTITSTGGLYRIGLETCVTENFPFLSWESCTAGINDMLALLTFNAMNPSNQNLGTIANNNPNSCHELGTLGDWMNQDNTTVCPGFNSEVRNTVTPFITFILGAMVFYWISRGKGVVVD